MNKLLSLLLFLLVLPPHLFAEKCSGYISYVQRRDDDILIYFNPTGFTQISGGIDTNVDPSGYPNQKYVRIKYPSDYSRWNQLLSLALSALSTDSKVIVEYVHDNAAPTPPWNVTSLSIQK